MKQEEEFVLLDSDRNQKAEYWKAYNYRPKSSPPSICGRNRVW